MQNQLLGYQQKYTCIDLLVCFSDIFSDVKDLVESVARGGAVG